MDIVERLRRYRPTYGWPEERSVTVELTLNHVAADEIERLRKQNAVLETELAAANAVDNEIERLRSEFRELHRDISMFMNDGPLKQDLLETIADVLGEEK